jgi:hypothetical protein
LSFFLWCVANPVIPARGVGHNPNPFAPVPRIDGTSRYDKDRRSISKIFQVMKHLVEPQIDVPNNILSNNPSGPRFVDNSKHFRPEVAVIIRAFSEPGLGERLTRVSAANKVWFCVKIVSFQFSNVMEYRHHWPMLAQHCSALFVYLTHRRDGHARTFKS